MTTKTKWERRGESRTPTLTGPLRQTTSRRTSESKRRDLLHHPARQVPTDHHLGIVIGAGNLTPGERLHLPRAPAARSRTHKPSLGAQHPPGHAAWRQANLTSRRHAYEEYRPTKVAREPSRGIAHRRMGHAPSAARIIGNTPSLKHRHATVTHAACHTPHHGLHPSGSPRDATVTRHASQGAASKTPK